MVNENAQTLVNTEVHNNKSGILLYSDLNNTDTLWVGYSSSITANQDNDMDGFPIFPVNTLELELAKPTELFIRSTSLSAQKIWFIML